jgi:hypothetical protein
MYDLDLAAQFFAALKIGPRTLAVRNGWATCEAYVSASDIARAKAAGFGCACRRSGKAWTLAVRVEDITDTESARIDID